MNVKPNLSLKAVIGGPINWENTGKIFNIADSIRSKFVIRFKKPQSLDKVYYYSKVLYELFTLLTRHKNLDIVMRIVMYYKHDSVTITNDYGIYMNNDIKENYSTKINVYNSMQVENLWESIQNLFGFFFDQNLKPNLDFCCDNNEDLFSSIDVINVCNSLNREFDILCIYFKRFNDYTVKYIYNLKRKDISQTKKNELIKCIQSCNGEKLEKVYLKLKIEILFKWFLKYIKIIEKNSNRDRLPYNYKNFIKLLPKFIDIRNSAAHAFVEWNESKNLMTHMEMIVYLAIFYRAGYNLKAIIDEISKVF